MKIRVLKDGQVVDSLDALWTIDIADIAESADELGPERGADDWEIINGGRCFDIDQAAVEDDQALNGLIRRWRLSGPTNLSRTDAT